MNKMPQTDEEWIIHANNIHGFFFESLCRKLIADTDGWNVVSTNYPVSYPASNGFVKGNESNLDIRAQTDTNNIRLNLLVECKKRNPEFVNWIFFPRNPYSVRDYSHCITIVNHLPRQEPALGWIPQMGVQAQNITGAIVTEDARETRGSYLKFKGKEEIKTKTTNDAITSAAYQVALATQAITAEELLYSQSLGNYLTPPKLPYILQAFLPAIITNAELFICDYDPSDVDPSSGEVVLNKAKLTSCSSLVYEYPLPKHLQGVPQDLATAIIEGKLELFTRLHIFIINIKALQTFLTSLDKKEPLIQI